MSKESDILSEAQESFKDALEYEHDSRTWSLEDARFVNLGEQWPLEVRRQRELAQRPCLTINRLPSFVRQVVNDARQNKPSIKVSPVDSNADPETAEVISGMIRHIERTGVTVEEVQAQRGQLAICLDDDLEAVLAHDGGARPIDPAALDSVLRPNGNRPVHYAFQYESPPQDLRLRLSPAPSRLNADVTTVVSVREGAVAYVSEVDFEIRQAGRSRFQVVTPEWLGDDLELQGDQIRQVRSHLNDQRRTWDIELQQPVRGTYCLHLIQTLPLPDDGTVPAAIIRPLDVERSRSHLVLENVTADEIAASTIGGAAPIAIAEVPGVLADNVLRQAVARIAYSQEQKDNNSIGRYNETSPRPGQGIDCSWRSLSLHQQANLRIGC